MNRIFQVILITVVSFTCLAQTKPGSAVNPPPANGVSPTPIKYPKCPIDAEVEKYQQLQTPDMSKQTTDKERAGNTNNNLAAIAGAAKAGIGTCILPDGTLRKGSQTK